jgi:hypothetical protein
MENKNMKNVDNYIKCFKVLVAEGEKTLRNISNSKYNNENCTSLFLIYRDFLSYSDSFANLLEIKNLKGMLNQLRTIIEVKANIDYMLLDNITEKAIAHRIFSILNKIKMYERYDSRTALGKDFHKKWLKDKTLSQIKYIDKDTSSEVEELKNGFLRPPYSDVYSKFTNKEKYWYSYNNGPKNVQELCDLLCYPILYENHYRLLSGILHGSDLYYYGLTPGADGKMNLENIHGEINMPFVRLGLKWTYLVINDYCEKVFNNYRLPDEVNKIFKK